jgi:hypothetical protein
MLKTVLISLAITLASMPIFSVVSIVVHLWGNQSQLGLGALLAYSGVLNPALWFIAVAAFFLTFRYLMRTA